MGQASDSGWACVGVRRSRPARARVVVGGRLARRERLRLAALELAARRLREESSYISCSSFRRVEGVALRALDAAGGSEAEDRGLHQQAGGERRADGGRVADGGAADGAADLAGEVAEPADVLVGVEQPSEGGVVAAEEERFEGRLEPRAENRLGELLEHDRTALRAQRRLRLAGEVEQLAP